MGRRRRVDVKATQATDPIAFHGEGPFWDAAADRLLLVDMLAGDVLSLDADAAIGRHRVGTVAAAIRARRSGGYVVAVERGFAFADSRLESVESLDEVFDTTLNRMNDGGCDPQGRFYCGTMAYAETPGAASLYRLDPDGSVHTVLSDVTISNGLQWSADGSRAFYNDTPTGEIAIFDFDGATGEFSNRRTFAKLADDGLPDGLAIDSNDGLWVAVWGGSAVQHFDSRGVLEEVIELPVSNVTACTFGGVDFETLYITTSRLGLAPDAQPLAGSVFTADVGVRGAPQHDFAG
jgi:sugar lactone lactonase YvrE